MKILWLAHEGNISGANICLLEFLEILNKNSTTNNLIVPWQGSMSAKAAEIANQVFPVKFYPWIWPLHSKKASLSLRTKMWIRNKKAVSDISKLIKEINPDFVVTNTVTTPVAALAAKENNIRHIWFIHEFGEEDHGYTIGNNFQKSAAIINELSYKVAFNSNAVYSKYEMFVPKHKSFIVHNALLMDAQTSQVHHNSQRLKLVMLGQVSPSKNQFDAIKALKHCLENGIDAELNIVGKAEGNSYMNKLENFILENNLKENVHFLGTTETPETVLEANEVLLMCSRMEAFGRVTVEALKHGMPVIAANTGGTPEIIFDGVNGYLYQSGNYLQLAEKILLYHNNKHSFDRDKISIDAKNAYNFLNTQKQLLEVFS